MLRSSPASRLVLPLLCLGGLLSLLEGCSGSSPAPATTSTTTTIPAQTSPVLSAISPATVVAGSADLTLSLTGQNFPASSAVQWNGTSLTSVTLSATQIQATVPAALLATSGTGLLTVSTGSTPLATSNSTPFTVTAPIPIITAISTPTATVGSGPLSVTLTGTNFVSASTVLFAGTPLPTTYTSPTQIGAIIPSTLLAAIGPDNLTVSNPAPNAATSLPLVFTVTALPPPSISIGFSSDNYAGSQPFTLTVNGSGFTPGSTIHWAGQTLTTTFVSATQLTANLTAALLATPGIYPVTVVYAGSPAITSAPANFTLDPLPAGMSILNLVANDIVADPVRPVLYASVSSSSAQNSNSIVTIDPTTGKITNSIATGLEPDRLAVSDDGQFLYVGIDGVASGATGVPGAPPQDGTVARFHLPDFTQDFNLSLTTTSGDTITYDAAADLAVAPGLPHVWYLRSTAGVSIYDDAVKRGATLGDFYPQIDHFYNVTWGGNSTVLYGTGQTGFYAVPVGPSGLGTVTTLSNISAGAGHMHFLPSTGYIYSDNGYVIDPSTGQQVGTFNSSHQPVQGPMATDASTKKAFSVETSAAGQFSLLTSFDLRQYTTQSQLEFPTATETPVHLIRFGASGLAFNTINYTYIRGRQYAYPKSGRIYLYSGSFVRPQ